MYFWFMFCFIILGVKDNFNHNDLKTKQVGSLIDNLSHDKNITSGNYFSKCFVFYFLCI